jgi:hypothetical protein
MVWVENEWRDINCPTFEHLSGCPRPEPCYECPEAWSCEDMRVHIVEIME